MPWTELFWIASGLPQRRNRLLTTGDLVDRFCDIWNDATGDNISWINKHDSGPQEANFLKLDCSKIKSTFGRKPLWNVATAVEKVVEWTVAYMNVEDVKVVMNKQVGEVKRY